MNRRSIHTETGAALIVALLLLLVMSLLAVSGLQTTGLDEKMAGNLRDDNVAFQSAESGLRDAEDWLAATSTVPTAVSSCSSSPCDVWELDAAGDPSDQSDSWWTSNGREYGTSGSKDIATASADPRYIIEQQSFVPDDMDPETRAKGIGNFYYRNTVHATGMTPDAQSVLRSLYAKRFK